MKVTDLELRFLDIAHDFVKSFGYITNENKFEYVEHFKGKLKIVNRLKDKKNLAEITFFHDNSFEIKTTVRFFDFRKIAFFLSGALLNESNLYIDREIHGNPVRFFADTWDFGYYNRDLIRGRKLFAALLCNDSEDSLHLY